MHVCVCACVHMCMCVCCSMCGACPWECICVFLGQIRTLSQVPCRRLLLNCPPSEERRNLLFLIAERFYHAAMWTFTEFCSGACWENHVFCYYFSCWQGEWVINFPRAAGLCAPRSSSWAQGIPFHLRLLLALLDCPHSCMTWPASSCSCWTFLGCRDCSGVCAWSWLSREAIYMNSFLLANRKSIGFVL